MTYINAYSSNETLHTDIKELIPDALLRRRMSRIVKMGVSVGMECVRTIGADNIDAIITATGFGCLEDSEKFLRTLIENNEEMLNPTPFIQSTFNTVGGQIALLCKNHNYNMTYTHRGRSFESALLDAILLLENGEAKNILLGAFDNTTATQQKIMDRMGFWKNASPGEGAYFFLLSSEKNENSRATVIIPEFLSAPILDDGSMIYNDYSKVGTFHTAAAAVMFDALNNGKRGSKVTLYNSYFQKYPTLIHLTML